LISTDPLGQTGDRCPRYLFALEWQTASRQPASSAALTHEREP
jgi:hypothetical protein